MQECPQCRKLFDPTPISGDFCPDCADSIRDEFGLPASLQRVWDRWRDRARWLVLMVSRREHGQAELVSPLRESRIRIIASFIVHQVVGTWGVAVTVPFLVVFVGDFLRLFGKTIPMRNFHWILTETGYFPLQIAFALFLGWLLGRDLRRQSMLWIWVLPFAILCYAVAAVPTVSPFPIPPTLQSGIGQSRFLHYFGSGCVAEHRCLDQIIITMPFYTATSYSIGTLLATRIPQDSQLAKAIRFWASLTLGLVFLAGAAALVIEATQPEARILIRQTLPEGLGPLRWSMLVYGLVPLATGTSLILYANWLRRNREILPVTKLL
jgi:hypothetical protein